MFITGNLGKDMPPIQKILRAKNSSLYTARPRWSYGLMTSLMVKLVGELPERRDEG
jgi:hypothetical protein